MRDFMRDGEPPPRRREVFRVDNLKPAGRTSKFARSEDVPLDDGGVEPFRDEVKVGRGRGRSLEKALG